VKIAKSKIVEIGNAPIGLHFL